MLGLPALWPALRLQNGTWDWDRTIARPLACKFTHPLVQYRLGKEYAQNGRETAVKGQNDAQVAVYVFYQHIITALPDICEAYACVANPQNPF